MLTIALRCCVCTLLAGEVLLAIPATAHDQLKKAALPRSIATAGQRIEAAIEVDAVPTKSLALAAFGRHWALARSVSKRVAEFDAPQVRVRTNFQIVDERRPEVPVGELIVYPEATLYHWPAELDLALGDSVPAIIRQWLTAQKIPVRNWSDKHASTAVGKPGLLMLGQAEAGTTIDELMRIRTATSRTFLVLNADWHAHSAAQDVPVDGTSHDLLPAPNRPVPVARVDRYWPGVASRRLLLHAQSSFVCPLVEFIWVKPSGAGVALSYVDWGHSLARNDDVDRLFANLLQSLAAMRGDENPLLRTVEIIWPPDDDISDAARPMLSALKPIKDQAEVHAKVLASGNTIQRKLFILDLRGPDLSPKDASTIALPDLGMGNALNLPELFELGTDARVQGGLFTAGDGSALRKAAKQLAPRFQLDWNPADDLLPLGEGSFVDPASRLQQVYRVTLRWTACGLFIRPTYLELASEQKDAHH